MKTAVITGVTGQDGAYLADYLISIGYKVYGLKRRSSSFNTSRINHFYKDEKFKNNFEYLYFDLTDLSSIVHALKISNPDEIYNLGAQSHVQVSFANPLYTSDVVALGTLRILEAIRILNLESKVKLYQASTSELYGLVQEIPQSETTPFYPRSPYAVAKLYSYWIIRNYKEAYNIFASNGILFNHESPFRGETFVTRKITRGIAKMCYDKNFFLELGNINSKRDWGHAKDYVIAMHKILQQEKPDDYVIATGVTKEIREFITTAFDHLGVGIVFQGEGVNEVGIVISHHEKFIYDKSILKIGRTIIKINPKFYRPTEVELLVGDPEKSKRELNWEPKYSFEDLVYEMLDFDLERERKNNSLEQQGFTVNQNIEDII
jgi:GDPmannose 4,6-dehydratase